MMTLDEAMEYLLTIDNPVEACARTYVAVYGNCVEMLDGFLSRKKDGLDVSESDGRIFEREVDKLGKLEQLVMYQFVVPGAVSAVLGRARAVIDSQGDYGECALLFDEIRGRQVNRYVDDEETEGIDDLDDDAVSEPVLGFLSYDAVLPANYTPEFREFVRHIEDEMLKELGRRVPDGAPMPERAAAVRDLVVEYTTAYPFYGIHRILSGAMLPCVKS